MNTLVLPLLLRLPSIAAHIFFSFNLTRAFPRRAVCVGAEGCPEKVGLYESLLSPSSFPLSCLAIRVCSAVFLRQLLFRFSVHL